VIGVHLIPHKKTMNEQDKEHIERHLELCRQVFLRMLAEDSWPWKEDDSQESEDVIESENIESET
jgi:hypothetical protein